jgi:hypothetical protein
MTPAERKAVGRMVRLACDKVATAMGNAPIYPNRAKMREGVAQFVEQEMALLDTPGMLATWIIAANQDANQDK